MTLVYNGLARLAIAAFSLLFGMGESKEGDYRVHGTYRQSLKLNSRRSAHFAQVQPECLGVNMTIAGMVGGQPCPPAVLCLASPSRGQLEPPAVPG